MKELTENELRKLDILITLKINRLKEIVENDDLRYKYTNGDISLMYEDIKTYNRILDKLYGREIADLEEE